MHKAKRASLDSPRGFEGVVSTHGATCAICSGIEEFRRPFAGAHHARHFMRVYKRWSYLPRWGWVCRACRVRIPSLSAQHDEAYRKITGREPSKGPRRVYVQLSFSPPMK